MSQSLYSLAFGVGTQNRQGNWLEVFYAQPLLAPSAELVAAVAPVLGYSGGNQAIAFTTTQAAELAAGADLAVVLHEAAPTALGAVEVPSRGWIVVVVGPEGGLTDEEVAAFEGAGAHAVRLGTEVLRTSTAGVAAVAALLSRTPRWA